MHVLCIYDPFHLYIYTHIYAYICACERRVVPCIITMYDTNRLGEAIPDPGNEDEDVNQVALAGGGEQVREEEDHHLSRPNVVLDDPLQGVRAVLEGGGNIQSDENHFFLHINC